VGEAIDERTTETLALENGRPFLKRKIRRDYGRTTLVRWLHISKSLRFYPAAQICKYVFR
jgi:hypothetical protein